LQQILYVLRELSIKWCSHLLSIQIMGHEDNLWTFNSPNLLKYGIRFYQLQIASWPQRQQSSFWRWKLHLTSKRPHSIPLSGEGLKFKFDICLIPIIPCVYLLNYEFSNISRIIIFSKTSKCEYLKKSQYDLQTTFLEINLKKLQPLIHGIHKIKKFKHQSLLFWRFFLQQTSSLQDLWKLDDLSFFWVLL
jgi:hypothetical protein